jgi:hypothetical protein
MLSNGMEICKHRARWSHKPINRGIGLNKSFGLAHAYVKI